MEGYEVIESDFARLESDTKASEATAQKEYDELNCHCLGRL
jgi:hypothetical protein